MLETIDGAVEFAVEECGDNIHVVRSFQRRAAAKAMIRLRVDHFATGAKVSSKLMSCFCSKPRATSQALRSTLVGLSSWLVSPVHPTS